LRYKTFEGGVRWLPTSLKHPKLKINLMRIISEFETQFKLGQDSLNKIKLDYTSRDDITKLLLGIQYMSSNKEVIQQIFQILKKEISIKSIGRSGMSL
jgi:hypothetical protein